MNVEPYLFFNGRCEEALEFYRTVFNAEPAMLMRHRDSPDAPPMPLPEGWADKILHAAIKIGDTMVMASDGCSDQVVSFNGFSLSVQMPDAAAAHRAYDALAVSGAPQMPLGPTFFSPCFGMVVDRFGLGWMLIVPA
jgi:PhnB protein